MQEVTQSQLLDRGADAAAPTLASPVDQAEELLLAEAERQSERFLRLVHHLLVNRTGDGLDMVIAATIRSDRFESLQTRAELVDVGIEVFADLKPMPTQQFKEVITGPADRATEAGRPLELDPDLVDLLT